jgi:hypothetical protein
MKETMAPGTEVLQDLARVWLGVYPLALFADVMHRSHADEDAPAVLAADQPLGLEDLDRLAGGHASDAVGLGHGGFARPRSAP